MVEVLENVPEMQTTEEAAMEKKKKKREKKKGVDIEDMYGSWDADVVQKSSKAKPVKKKKETPPEELTAEKIAEALTHMARIGGEQKQQGGGGLRGLSTQFPRLFFEHEAEQEEAEPSEVSKDDKKVEEKEQDSAVPVHCASPNRSRQGSPKKRESPEKEKTSMKASAAEFVPPGISCPPKETSSTCLKASSPEFVPPGFSSPVKSLQASATEFVPQGLEPMASSKAASDSSKSEPSATSTAGDTSTEACWAHAVLTPSAPTKVLSADQPPQQSSQPPAPLKVPLPALALGEIPQSTEGASESDGAFNEDPKWTARLDLGTVGTILGKVKQSLMFRPGGSAAPAAAANPCPEIGKVMDKVKKIEEKEADNEAEKERAAAIKALQEKQNAEKKKEQLAMNETLMDCFLQAVKTRVKDRDLPIMGTTLYGKHMRAARQIGTSCDVKDSTFVWVRAFFESLEDENLIKLKPEVKDPTVTWINRNHHLIRDWQPWAFSETVGSRQACGPTRRR